MLSYACVWSAYPTCRSRVVATQRAIVQARGVGGSTQKMMFGFGARCLLVGVHVATYSRACEADQNLKTDFPLQFY